MQESYLPRIASDKTIPPQSSSKHAQKSSIGSVKQEKLEAVSVLRAGAAEHPFQRGGAQQAH